METKKLSASDIVLPYKIPDSDFTIEVLPAEKIDAAISVLTKVWRDLEPITLWSKMSCQELYQILHGMVTKSPGPMLSIIISNAMGEIVAVSLNREFTLECRTFSGNPVGCLAVDLDNMYRKFYAEKKREGKVVSIEGIGVLNGNKGKGLANYLFLASIAWAQKKGYKLTVLQASIIYTCHICDKLGMKRITEIKYDDYEYVDKDGRKLRPFAGLDQWFTQILNKRRGKGKELITTASSCVVYEGDISKLVYKKL